MSVHPSCPYTGMKHIHSTVRTGRLFYVHASVQYEKRRQVQGGEGMVAMATYFVCLSLFISLSVSQTPCPVSGGWVYELDPVALICRESELSD